MHRALLSFLVCLIFIVPAAAGPGHDHGEHASDTSAAVQDVPRIASVGSELELVAVAEGHKLTIYLDRLATNEPVDGAAIEVSGDGIAPIQAKRIAPGLYEIEADWLDVPGTKALLFTVSSGETADLLNGTLTVAGHEEKAQTTPVPLADILVRRDVLGIIIGTVALGFVFAFAIRSRRRAAPELGAQLTPENSSHIKSVSLRDAAEVIVVVLLAGCLMATAAMAGPGHDHGDGGHDAAPAKAGSNVPRKLPDGSVFVPKPTQRLLQVRTTPAAQETAARAREMIGTVVSDPAAFGQVQAPMDGRIEVSDRGISFPGQKVKAGEVLALLSPTIPVADLGTMQQLRAEVEGKLIIAEQKLARLTKIANVVAQRDIEDTKAEVNALREQKRVLAPKDIEKVALKAPVSGIISIANVRAGQVVSARDTLFEIVDPNRLWVEGIGSDAHGEGDIVAAQAIDAEGHSIKLAYAGRSPTLRQQSQPFLFRIDDAHSGLVIGAPVKVFVQSKDNEKGIVVPEAAVVRATSGLAQVWVKVEPERFRAATVRTLQIDGTRTLLVAGVEVGDRIVTGGAELINQIR